MFSGKTIFVTLVLLVTAVFAQASEPKELVFLNWANYMDPDILVEFEQRTGISVKQRYFDSDTTRDELLLETEGKGFDLALVNGSSIRILAKRGWLEPLDESSIPNLKHVNPRWRSAFEQAENYGVPYSWGTIGIVYRKDLVPFTVSSWMDLLQPAEELHGKISMIGDNKDIVGVALKALGYSLNTTDEKALQEAEALLQAQAPAVKTYRYISIGADSALLTGQIVMSMMYNGDMRMLQQHSDNIAFVLPKEGGNIWTDYLSVLSASPRKADAKRFINFLNEPEIAARLAQFTHYATPNLSAEALLPAEFRNDPVIYPTGEALENSEAYGRLPPRAQKRQAAIVSRLVQGG
ncbi:spermidine/putrescine ABC transporter substrate-binding protein [Marinobacter sp. F3R11]|uniref:polyamine ABC transporter substrate-binding protein n=1 Tax=Marinobacter sp. F3R11 TaxID=2267231 RepID=UPI000DEB71DA|nr:spermidine/putrescine ABC transporter substrate-binding protein [Marinobacter sp. F3R11]RBW51816.1 spermidine/putrescine ABC transporter substrate-binding protein [Marinobacter sp. F3R11]